MNSGNNGIRDSKLQAPRWGYSWDAGSRESFAKLLARTHEPTSNCFGKEIMQCWRRKTKANTSPRTLMLDLLEATCPNINGIRIITMDTLTTADYTVLRIMRLRHHKSIRNFVSWKLLEPANDKCIDYPKIQTMLTIFVIARALVQLILWWPPEFN